MKFNFTLALFLSGTQAVSFIVKNESFYYDNSAIMNDLSLTEESFLMTGEKPIESSMV